MQYVAIEPVQFRNKKVEAGDTFTIKNDDAIKPLIEAGKITPIEKVSYKIYSELLGCCLWVVTDEKDMKTLRNEGITEPIYTHREITELKKLPKGDIKEIHKVKQVFPDAKVNLVNLTKQGELR